LNEDARPLKASLASFSPLYDVNVLLQTGLHAINARVYAVKANRNRLLDVARETYKENVSDIFALQRALSEKHELPIQLVYQEGANGFVFVVKKLDIDDKPEIPPGFINVSTQKGKISFSSLELVRLHMVAIVGPSQTSI
jgi:DNA mismatch repair protein MSH4